MTRLTHPDAAKLDDEVRTQEWEPALTSAVMGNWQGTERGPKLEIIEALLAHGANVNAPDFRGNTALGFAAGQGDLVKLLLAHGANLNLRDAQGRTALGQVLSRRLPAPVLVKLLESAGGQP